MTIQILMPALSPTMEEGTLSKWLVKEGDKVSSGDLIAEIETDKATMEVESIEEGVIGKLCVDEGTTGIAVNSPIAFILEPGEKSEDLNDIVSLTKTNVNKNLIDSSENKKPEKFRTTEEINTNTSQSNVTDVLDKSNNIKTKKLKVIEFFVITGNLRINSHTFQL